jgi:hypothetical protein
MISFFFFPNFWYQEIGKSKQITLEKINYISKKIFEKNRRTQVYNINY